MRACLSRSVRRSHPARDLSRFGVPFHRAPVVSQRDQKRVAHCVADVPVHDRQIALDGYIVGPHRECPFPQRGSFSEALAALTLAVIGARRLPPSRS